MTQQRIQGSTGNLYDPKSEAAHRALEELRSTLLDVGFVVAKKAQKESTLRVYPLKHGEYPLLNPYFDWVPNSDDDEFEDELEGEHVNRSDDVMSASVDGDVLAEEHIDSDGDDDESNDRTGAGCIVFAVFSRGDPSSFDAHLATFEPTTGSEFVAMPEKGKDHNQHGYFVVPLVFSGEQPEVHIDFVAMRPEFARMLAFLKTLPA